MAHRASIDSQHTEFTKWARSQGVTVNGVEPARISGRGLGVCATRKIKAGEVLNKVPASTLYSVKSVPKFFRDKHVGITVHGLLASFLAFGGQETERYGTWKASWPIRREFEASMPLLWNDHLRKALPPLECQKNQSCFPLPPAIGGRWAHPKMSDFFNPRECAHISRQEKKFHFDWGLVSKVFPQASLEEYRYYWLVINTRSFYWEFPGEELPHKHDDRMVLVPWVDYFNHSDQGCKVSFDEGGFTVTSDRDYDVGDELYTSYGNHSNDFLLVEYGFILDSNKWDSLPLDDFFNLSKFDDNKKNQLKAAGFWGNYTLGSEGVCHRTQVAVRALTTNLARFKAFVAGKGVNGDREESKADSFIAVQILQVYYETSQTTIKYLESEDGNMIPSGIRTTLITRWHQISRMIQEAAQNGLKESARREVQKFLDLSEDVRKEPASS